MPSVNSVKDTIARELVVGTPLAREYVLPVTGLPALDSEVTKESDPAITGLNMAAGSWLMGRSGNDSGTPISPRACPAVVLATHSALGGGTIADNNLVGVEVGAIVRIRYTGDSASCKITAIAGTSITSAIGVKGGEAVDSDFGTTGVLAAGALTAATLVSTIDAYDHYEAKFVMGDRSTAVTTLIALAAAGKQAKGKWVFLYFTSTTSDAYQYPIAADVTTAERPSLTRQVDNRGGNEAWGGFVVDQLSFSAAIQGYMEGNLQGPALAQYRPQIKTGTTATSTTVSAIDTREILPGMTVTGAGIPAAATVASVSVIDEDGTFILSDAATASATVALTFDITASAATLVAAAPFRFAEGKTALDGVITKFIRNMSVDINNNHAADIGYGQGSFDRQLQQKGIFGVTGAVQFALNVTTYLFRAKVHEGDLIPLHFEFTGSAIGTSGMREWMLIEIPYAEVTGFGRPDNSSQIDGSIEYMATSPAGTQYDGPFTITYITGQATI